MSTWKSFAGTAVLAVLGVVGSPPARAAAATLAQGGALSPDYLDQLLAPVALYPDPLLAQILLCSGNPSKVGELGAWLKQMASRPPDLRPRPAGLRGHRPRRQARGVIRATHCERSGHAQRVVLAQHAR